MTEDNCIKPLNYKKQKGKKMKQINMEWMQSLLKDDNKPKDKYWQSRIL